MAVVGERFDSGKMITGVVFSRRQKEDRICIWTRNLSEQGETIEREIKKKLAEQFREFLGIGQGGNLQYSEIVLGKKNEKIANCYRKFRI